MSDRVTSLRIPGPIYEELHLRAHLRSIERRRRVGVGTVINELLQQALRGNGDVMLPSRGN